VGRGRTLGPCRPPGIKYAIRCGPSDHRVWFERNCFGGGDDRNESAGVGVQWGGHYVRSGPHFDDAPPNLDAPADWPTSYSAAGIIHCI
jgi:hypothetical protein